MATFLKVLLVAFLVIVGLNVLALFLVRVIFRRWNGKRELLAPYLMAQTARIKLRVDDTGTTRAADFKELNRRWADLAAAGFQPLGAFVSDDDDRICIAGQHPADNMLAQVVHRSGAAPYVEFITLSSAGKAKVLSGEPMGRALQLASLSVDVQPAPGVGQAVAAFASAPDGRALDARMAMLLIERIHATRMDAQLARAPSRAEIKQQGALLGAADLNEAQLERALELNQRAWLEQLDVALLDNARRRLKLEEDPWQRLKDDLIVVHQGMDADQVISTLSAHALVEQLGAQLKRQNFGPGQIFDEINRRLDPAEQRQLVLYLGFPVRCSVFARSGALQAAGVSY